jgi:eukaryotic-like serine/threonine-protein kinase
VGPIAKVMVRRVAKDAHDVVSLTERLAEKLSSAQRDEFLKNVGVISAPGATSPGSKANSVASPEPNTGTGSQHSLTPEDVSRASQLLTAQLGPIAPILAKRAAQGGCTREQFIAALASHLSDDATRSRFIDALR